MKLVPLHSVVLSRPDPAGGTKKDGSKKHVRVAVPMGKVFNFTDDEVKDLQASGHEFRTPNARNEGEGRVVLDADAADRAALEAAQEASAAGGAGLDALETLKAGNRGKAKPPTVETGVGDQEAAEQDEEDNDL